ncbi:protein of unknown function [endosymbiont DhMRE of Dentiscutata heterogama]|uniref:hypothetical protein n=1 Tax=endosymbiont DhMRE of Dentiscutata heterogama TaxID=1609546 RepID=UPI0006363414|nr:hypothetical protein [endosymbiont DhMRE of Dentiscutata heterogama]CFW92693.1 protein of unknown function [endosymbiont DhMRE of Dentiscutata heterogama]
MTELLIIKTANANKLKSILAKNHIEHEVIYNQLLVDKKPSSKKDKLREYIEMKSKENIFADYGKAIKDKEREKEISLWEKADEEDEEELSRKYAK